MISLQQKVMCKYASNGFRYFVNNADEVSFKRNGVHEMNLKFVSICTSGLWSRIDYRFL